jgi:predicted O-methyltransferase YrrM
VPLVAATTVVDSRAWYPPALVSASMIACRALRAETVRSVAKTLEALERDAYVEFLLSYYKAGLDRFGDGWRYADITTVLAAAAELIGPRRYLEIGVRRGRSLAVVAQRSPTCHITGFDLWVPDYAGMANPGPSFVRGELAKLGHAGPLDLVSGDSHVEVPRYFRSHPDAFFDLITVDGDHSRRGAALDLRAVIPRLAIGGALVFDDIAHPLHRYLRPVWEQEVERDERFATWRFDELGYGVALAVRREE